MFGKLRLGGKRDAGGASVASAGSPAEGRSALHVPETLFMRAHVHHSGKKEAITRLHHAKSTSSNRTPVDALATRLSGPFARAATKQPEQSSVVAPPEMQRPPSA